MNIQGSKKLNYVERYQIRETFKSIRKIIGLRRCEDGEKCTFQLSDNVRYRCNSDKIRYVFKTIKSNNQFGNHVEKSLKKEMIRDRNKNIREVLNRVGEKCHESFDCFEFAIKILNSEDPI